MGTCHGREFSASPRRSNATPPPSMGLPAQKRSSFVRPGTPAAAVGGGQSLTSASEVPCILGQYGGTQSGSMEYPDSTSARSAVGFLMPCIVTKHVFPHRHEKPYVSRRDGLHWFTTVLPLFSADTRAVVQRQDMFCRCAGLHGWCDVRSVTEPLVSLASVDKRLREAPYHVHVHCTSNLSSLCVRAFNAVKSSDALLLRIIALLAPSRPAQGSSAPPLLSVRNDMMEQIRGSEFLCFIEFEALLQFIVVYLEVMLLVDPHGELAWRFKRNSCVKPTMDGISLWDNSSDISSDELILNDHAKHRKPFPHEASDCDLIKSTSGSSHSARTTLTGPFRVPLSLYAKAVLPLLLQRLEAPDTLLSNRNSSFTVAAGFDATDTNRSAEAAVEMCDNHVESGLHIGWSSEEDVPVQFKSLVDPPRLFAELNDADTLCSSAAAAFAKDEHKKSRPTCASEALCDLLTRAALESGFFNLKSCLQ